MTCTSDVAALLPFHAAGTLAPADRRSVEEHLPTCPVCRAELALWGEVSPAIRAELADGAALPPGTIERALLAARSRDVHPLARAWSLLRVQVPLVQRGIWVASAFVMALGCAVAGLLGRSAVFAALAPLIAAAGVSAISDPDNDAALELELATPTSRRQVLLARLLLVFGYDLALALGGSVALAGFEPGWWPGAMVSQWLAPMTCLAALALLLSLTIGAHAASGVAFALWLLRGVSLDGLLPPPALGVLAVYRQAWRSPGALAVVAAVCLLAGLWIAGRQTARLTRA